MREAVEQISIMKQTVSYKRILHIPSGPKIKMRLGQTQKDTQLLKHINGYGVNADVFSC